MTMPGKKYQEAQKLIDANKLYSAEEAIELVKKTAKTKFDGSVEVHCVLGIDPAKNEQQVRVTVALPHGTGKTKKVAAFVDSVHEKEAEESGADIIATEQTIAEIAASGKINFDIAIAVP